MSPVLKRKVKLRLTMTSRGKTVPSTTVLTEFFKGGFGGLGGLIGLFLRFRF